MTRGRFEGMWNILRFNRRLYALASVSSAALLILTARRPEALYAALPALFWMFASLAVSHYVYDLSPLYELDWLARILPRPPRHWLSLHAGLDEMSAGIARLFPQSEGQVVDIFDPREMTEPSIHLARRAAGTPTDWKALPFTAAQFDTAFLIFAAHELRRPEARARLFAELARTLRPGGELILVEHLRDWANFLAFWPRLSCTSSRAGVGWHLPEPPVCACAPRHP